MARTRAYVEELVPNVRLWETTHGRVPLELALDTHRYQPQNTSSDPLDIHVHPEPDAHHHHDHDHDHHHDHDHEHDDHTLVFNTWRYTTDEPFAHIPFRQMMKAMPATIFRVKGFVHLNNMPHEKMLLQMAGTRINMNRIGPWQDEPPRTDLVFIAEAGKLNPAEIEAHLAACFAKNVPDSDSILDEMASWLRSLIT